jgi:hypothetical protein
LWSHSGCVLRRDHVREPDRHRGARDLFFALILLAGGVAATLLPLRRADLVKRAGARDEARWLGVPTITWIGVATTALALFTVIKIVIHSSVYGKFSGKSIATLLVVLAAGPVIYAMANHIRHQHHQLDLSMAMHELPPE